MPEIAGKEVGPIGYGLMGTLPKSPLSPNRNPS